jgi:hypothetical protein
MRSLSVKPIFLDLFLLCKISRKKFRRVFISWIRICIPNVDEDPGGNLKADLLVSGSETVPGSEEGYEHGHDVLKFTVAVCIISCRD